jgi:adenylate kinase
MNILIMGGPGAGKGTMSGKIVNELDVKHISTGDIFRSEIRRQTPIGMEAKNYMDQGLLVPDEVVNKMVISYLTVHAQNDELPNGFLLDGYPRTLEQAKAFDSFADGTQFEIEKVIVMDLDPAILAKRVTGRRICKSCCEIFHIETKPSKVEGICDACGAELYQRKDDTLESLNVRLGEYQNLTEPVQDYYEAKGIVTKVNADQPIDNVFAEVKAALGV